MVFFNFYGKTWVGLCLNIRERFSLELLFSNQQKDHRFLKETVIGIFKIALRLKDRNIFMWQSLEILNVFNTLILRQIFWKTKTFFKKLEYGFLVETTKIENTSFPFKTALSETNFKTNRMAATKWTYHKEWSFASNCFFHICVFRKRWNLILRRFFAMSILKLVFNFELLFEILMQNIKFAFNKIISSVSLKK